MVMVSGVTDCVVVDKLGTSHGTLDVIVNESGVLPIRVSTVENEGGAELTWPMVKAAVAAQDVFPAAVGVPQVTVLPDELNDNPGVLLTVMVTGMTSGELEVEPGGVVVTVTVPL
jgi:hypothetical protein